MKSRLACLVTGLAAGLVAASLHSTAAAKTDPRAVLVTYANIAQAGYEDSLVLAKRLSAAVDRFLAKPGPATLAAARRAWIAARVPYMQTEAFRFGNKIVDDWEGKVNAWPLDEGLIDYVAKSYGTTSKENPAYAANVIANRKLSIGGKTVDASKITAKLLRDTLHEFGGIEANVSIGYHAVEFMLWGQDLNGTGPGAGNRPWTDFSLTKCTNGNCDRRRDYLRVATRMVVSDLTWMVKQWAPGGKARAAVTAGDPKQGLSALITGLGSLSYGELAGERMKLGLMLHDPEEEHDCFSDNTHNSHYYDLVGILNVYYGRYTRIDGRKVMGPSLAAMVREANPALAKRVDAELKASLAAMAALKRRAEKVEAYDQMIGKGNKAGNAVVQTVVDKLKAQTAGFREVTTLLGVKAIKFEGSDSLDAPDKVFK